MTFLLLYPVYNSIKSWCLGAECCSHVVPRIQPISGFRFDVKQTGKSCFGHISCRERYQHSKSFFCRYRICYKLRSSKALQATIGKFHLQGGPIKCYYFSIIPKFSNVNLFKIFIQRFVIRNIKPTFNINEFVKSELCRERNKDLCSVCV